MQKKNTMIFTETQISMGQVINLIINGIKNNFKKNIIKALLISLVIFILNYLLLIKYKNTGLGTYFSSTLAISGNRFGGTLFWSLAGAYIVNLFSKIKEGNKIFQFSRLKPAVKSMISFSKNEFKTIYIIGAILAVLFAIITGSASFSLMAALTIFSSSSDMKKSKLAYVINIIFSRLARSLYKNKSSDSIKSLMGGSTLGFIMYGLFAGNQVGMFIGMAIFVIFILVNLIPIVKKKKNNREGI